MECDESVLVTGLGYSYRYRARYGPGQTVLALAHHVKDGCWWWLDWTGASLRMSGGDVTMTSLYLPSLATSSNLNTNLPRKQGYLL